MIDDITTGSTPGNDLRRVLMEIVFYLAIMVIGNLIIQRNFHRTDESRWLALIGLIIVGVCIYRILFSTARLVDFVIDSNPAPTAKKSLDDSYDISWYISSTIFFLLIAFQIVYWIRFIQKETTLLERKGILIKVPIYERKWTNDNSNNNDGYKNYYRFNYGGQEVDYFVINDSLQLGDSIQIKFLPENPFNHEVVK